MIYGVGVDIIKIDRIQSMIQRYGDRFINRIFLEEEKEKAFKRTYPERTFAKIFAAKEAFIKALGGSFGLSWHDIVVSNNENGKPLMTLSLNAQKKMNSFINYEKYTLHLSLSDDPPHAIAYLIIEMV